MDSAKTRLLREVEAILAFAVFNSTILDRTNFDEVTIWDAIFANVDLSTVQGLKTILHIGPSTLGFDTLVQSGNLPQVFLRGCGLTEEFITYIPSLTNNPNDFIRVSSPIPTLMPLLPASYTTFSKGEAYAVGLRKSSFYPAMIFTKR